MTTENFLPEKLDLKKFAAVVVWIGLLGLAFLVMAVGSIAPIDFIYDGI